jgi:O-antigen/teichoic acid export membrane protein
LRISDIVKPVLSSLGVGNQAGKKYISNTIWVISDKVIRQGLSFFISAWIARYLMPEDYGILSYALAFSALFGAIAGLGIDSILVREIVKKPEDTPILLGTTFILRLITSILGFLITMAILYAMHPDDYRLLLITCLCSVVFVIQAVDVTDPFFQSQVKSKFVIYARNISFAITSIMKVTAIILKAPLEVFAWITVAEATIASAMMWFYYKKHQVHSGKWNFKKSHAGTLLRDSLPMALSNLVIILYMKIDQILLKEMMNDRAVGLYSAAVKLCEIWYFIPMVLCSSIYPGLVKARENNPKLYMETLALLYKGVFWLGVLIAIGVSLLSPWIILIYGQEFASAAGVLAIYSIATIATYFGIVTSQFLLAENLTKISFYRTFIGLVSNLLLNYLLIPPYGIMGSAVATLISYTIATFGLLFFRSTAGHMMFAIQSLFRFSDLVKQLKQLKKD